MAQPHHFHPGCPARRAAVAAAGRRRARATVQYGRTITFPGFAIYHATKWGVEGYFETLAREIEPFGIKTVLVEPGMVRTSFYDATRRAGFTRRTRVKDLAATSRPRSPRKRHRVPIGSINVVSVPIWSGPTWQQPPMSLAPSEIQSCTRVGSKVGLPVHDRAAASQTCPLFG
jgi:NAD(P)-dependent dehydrogenase (short-subunit alcohol dehydrogenase family)